MRDPKPALSRGCCERDAAQVGDIRDLYAAALSRVQALEGAREGAEALAERLSEYRKLKWSAPMKSDLGGRYQAVPLAFLEDAIAFIARTKTQERGEP